MDPWSIEWMSIVTFALFRPNRQEPYQGDELHAVTKLRCVWIPLNSHFTNINKTSVSSSQSITQPPRLNFLASHQRGRLSMAQLQPADFSLTQPIFGRLAGLPVCLNSIPNHTQRNGSLLLGTQDSNSWSDVGDEAMLQGENTLLEVRFFVNHSRSINYLTRNYVSIPMLIRFFCLHRD